MDDMEALNNAKPGLELYVPERVSWVEGVSGASQLKSMPGSEEVK